MESYARSYLQFYDTVFLRVIYRDQFMCDLCVRGAMLSLCHLILGVSKFVVLPKTVLTFYHKTNEGIVR